MTILTNVIMALLCFFWTYKLIGRNPFQRAWKNYFSIMGISTLLGAVVHGFVYYTGEYIQLNLWLIMQILIVSSIYFAESATAKYFFKQEMLIKFRYLFITKVAITAILILVFQNFLVVVVNIALGLIPVMVVFYRDYVKNRNFGGMLIALGILISFSSALIFVNKISLTHWFNYNDIGHVITMLSLYFMYKGASMLSKPSIV